MTEAEIMTSVQTIFRDVFDDNNLVIRREITANDIEEWDSLTHINLVVAIEKEFRTRFALGELQELKNVGDMIDLIIKKTS